MRMQVLHSGAFSPKGSLNADYFFKLVVTIQYNSFVAKSTIKSTIFGNTASI